MSGKQKSFPLSLTETGRVMTSLEWAGIRQDGKWSGLECSVREISRFFGEKIRYQKTRLRMPDINLFILDNVFPIPLSIIFAFKVKVFI